jgi:hypothetical protein
VETVILTQVKTIAVARTTVVHPAQWDDFFLRVSALAESIALLHDADGMRTLRQWTGWWVSLISVVAVSCTTPGNTGAGGAPSSREGAFVDFYVDSDDELCWFVAQAPQSAGPFKKVFYQTTPQPGRVLRLPVRPGQSFFRVSLVNRVVVETTPVEVTTVPGQVTPVAIVLTPAGAVQVQRDELGAHATVRGTIRTRRLEYGPDQSYRLAGHPESPVPFQTIDQMPYSGAVGK